MTSYAGWLLLGVGLIVALRTLPLVTLLRRVCRLRVRRGRVALIEPEAIPGDYAQLRDQLEPKLSALGFAYSHAQCRYSSFAGDSIPHYFWVYRHASLNAYATLGASMAPGRAGPPYQLEFISPGAQGESLSTVNGFAHQLLPVLPGLQLVDPLSADLHGQWQAHRQALETWQASPIDPTPGMFIAHEQDFMDRYLAALQAQGWLVADRQGRLAFPFRRALRFARQLLQGEQRAAAVLSGAEDHDLAMPLEAEIDGFRRQQAQSQDNAGWLGRTTLFVLSMLLFAYSFGLQFSWDFVLILVVVVSFHELGHLLGMWWFGYRDLRILFIPFFGAVAMGRDQQPRPGQQIVVSLLGPLPGLLLGMLLLLWVDTDNSHWLLPWVIMLLVLNYLNLLPIMPLDGGQVVNTALLSRLPRLQLVFLAISVVAAALGAWLLGEPVLWILTALVGLGTLSVAGRLKLRRSLRQRYPRAHELDEDTLLRGIFQRLRENDCRHLPFPRKVPLAGDLLRELRVEPPGLAVMILGLGGYGACLLLPVVWVLVVLPGLPAGPGYDLYPALNLDVQTLLADSKKPAVAGFF